MKSLNEQMSTFEKIIEECEHYCKSRAFLLPIYNIAVEEFMQKKRKSEYAFDSAIDYAFSRMRDYIYFGEEYNGRKN